ncbi:glycosyl transferase [Galliscardovia ingluviei]|uniref:Glycosyl transferase n=1 Tax=Galliscardovia ingluviei TaxID=1769422 RepID=A0A8J3EUX6_9BIFI|nr:glycosyltransferase [Galliscardovia ingluviei]GGI12500.1 glycosyl transferase [Galliscardovia ingluviei]
MQESIIQETEMKASSKPLTIALVLDSFGNRGNGTSNSALQYAAELEKLGARVRLVGIGAGTYAVPERHIPMISRIAAKQQMHFAQVDERVLRACFAGVDVVHIYMPFTFGRAALRVARSMGIPVTAGFHIQPENILYSAGPLRYIPGAVSIIYRLFRHWLYDHVQHIHVPTTMGAKLLHAHGYRANIHVISNGYEPVYTPKAESGTSENAADAADVADVIDATDVTDVKQFHIVASGRLTREKHHITLLRAVARCKHRNSIRVSIAGTGPLLRPLQLAARVLLRAQHGYKRVRCDIGFHEHNTMPDFLRSADLLVHPSLVDLESISVLEATACGVVPVIAQSPLSAASQFALTEHSLFPVRDVQALADAIDWWIEHPHERQIWSGVYAERAVEQYSLVSCAQQFMDMEQQALADAAIYHRDTLKRH